MRTTISSLLLSLALPAVCALAQSASVPTPRVPGVTITPFAIAEDGAVRLARDPISNELFFMKMNGEIKRVDSAAPPTLVYSAADHGIAATVGMTFGPDGTLYLVGNEVQGNYNVVTVRRGVPKPGIGSERRWSTVAHTAPYQRSNTNFDHNFNAIAASPDGHYLFLNSGSRTDHGEVQENNGAFPGTREVPLTSAIFRIPADGDDILLPNDEAALREGGYLYADGTRNSFDLAFSPDGELFATENSGDRDDNDEINWIRQGHHYGFPWRISTHDNPQRFPGYDPAADPLLNHASYAYTNGFFHNDSTFPPPPAGVTFTDPIMNTGPAGARYRDPADGSFKTGERTSPVSTLTPHRSPLGLVFAEQGPLRFAYVLSWTSGLPASGSLLMPFDDPGEDLLQLDFSSFDLTNSIRATSMASGFNAPIDAEMIGDALYVLDYGGEHTIWRVSPVLFLIAGVESTPSTPLALAPCSPNPFTTTTRFSVSMARAGHLRLDLVNMMGEKVTTIFDGRLSGSTSRDFTIDGTGLPNGVYAVRAEGEGFSIVRRVVLLR